MKFDTAAPYIACFVILRRDNTVAFVKRKNTNYMDGHYGLPAGKVEWGERYTHGAVREAHEEVGVTIDPKDVRFAHVCHRHDDNSDWIDILFEVSQWQGEVVNAEPEKCEEIAWLDMNNLPDNMVPAVRYCLEAIARGEQFSEYGWDA